MMESLFCALIIGISQTFFKIIWGKATNMLPLYRL